MSCATSLIRHRRTMSGWANDNKTWLWYEGPQAALEGLKEETLARYGSKVEVGLPEFLSDSDWRNPMSYIAFVFQDRDDAMMFKLSVT